MTAPRTTYLVCYDISTVQGNGQSRLARVRRHLLELAAPIQYSVFCGSFTPAGRNAVLEGLARRIDPRFDDVRLYPLPTSPTVHRLGRDPFPEGILTMGVQWLQGTGNRS